MRKGEGERRLGEEGKKEGGGKEKGVRGTEELIHQFAALLSKWPGQAQV